MPVEDVSLEDLPEVGNVKFTPRKAAQSSIPDQ
jgi:hypothetical protein